MTAHPPPYAADAIARFWTHVTKTDTCWLWTGARNLHGYGQLGIQRRNRYAHRVSNEISVGPIPGGLVIDHLCRNTNCVRPDHLEAVTDKVNILRGISGSAVNAKAASCKRGHPFTVANTENAKDGSRKCRTCRRDFNGKHPRAPQGPVKFPHSHCMRGHELTPENTKVASSGKRRCLTCKREYERLKNAAKKKRGEA